MQLPSLIEDGYTLQATIRGNPSRYAPLEVAYRPALFRERISFLKLASLSAEQQEEAIVSLVARHVVHWSILHPVNVETVRKMWPEQLSQLLDLILGQTETQQEQAEKNSPPGCGSSSPTPRSPFDPVVIVPSTCMTQPAANSL